MSIIRTNDQKKTIIDAASAFARRALSRVGGSSVYIEPKKTRGKLVDMDKVT